MKNFTLVAMLTAVGMTCSASAPESLMTLARMAKPAVAKTSSINKAYRFRAPSNNALWRPGTQVTYFWNGEEWEVDQTYKTTYNSEGKRILDLITEGTGEISRETSSYDENGMLTLKLSEISEDGGATFENNSREERKYYSRVTDFVVANYQWIWLNNDWMQNGNNYERTVTRDEAGNITKIVVACPYQGVYDPIQEINITYGADGKASTISQKDLTSNGSSLVWEDGVKYTDIVWESTDGQILRAEGFTSGANRIKSATIINGGMEFKQTVEYFEGSEKFISTIVVEKGSVRQVAVTTYEPLENDGYIATIEQTATSGDESYTNKEVETVKYDAYGNLLLEEYIGYDGDYEEIYGRTAGEVTYDSASGYPVKYEVTMLEWDEETDEPYMGKYLLVEFSDYTDVSGIDSISGDENAVPEYYNLQGIRVNAEALTPGIYIVKTGNTTKKIRI